MLAAESTFTPSLEPTEQDHAQQQEDDNRRNPEAASDTLATKSFRLLTFEHGLPESFDFCFQIDLRNTRITRAVPYWIKYME